MIRWYSLIVLAAILVGVWIAGREAERRGLGKETIYDLALWLVLAGIIGAQLFHVIDRTGSTVETIAVVAAIAICGGLGVWLVRKRVDAHAEAPFDMAVRGDQKTGG